MKITGSFQVGSYGHIFPNLRLISMTWDQSSAVMYFYVDKEISDDDLESINLIHTYFGVNFSDKEMESCFIEIIRQDFPAPIDSYPGQCMYARKESPPIGKATRGVMIEKNIDRRGKVLVAIQKAMINNIFPQIRSVYVEWTDTSAMLCFCVDGTISEDDKKSLGLMHAYFCLQFPQEEMELCETKIIRIDLPERITENYGTLVYEKKEAPEM